jgi:hypothetical protein
MYRTVRRYMDASSNRGRDWMEHHAYNHSLEAGNARLSQTGAAKRTVEAAQVLASIGDTLMFLTDWLLLEATYSIETILF